MPVAPDYLADYRALGCAPGCSPAELERAWRVAMSRVHPDRVPPDQRAEAIRQSQRVNAAYRRLRAFAQQHGRLPGSGVAAWPTVSAATRESDPHAPSGRPHARGGRRLAAVVAAAMVLAASWLLQAPAEVRPPRDRTAARPASNDAADTVALALDSPAEVLIAQAGAPPLRREDGRGGEVWEYGPSSVTLQAGRVVDWYISPLRPLPFPSERPPASDPLTAPPSRR